MKAQILSGNFTENGNFSGYNLKGERFHIHKQLMAAQKWVKNEDVKFPFYVIAGNREFTKVDANQEPLMKQDGTPDTFTRLQASAVFTTVENLANAFAQDALLDAQIAKVIKATVSAEGLTEEDMRLLQTAAI